VVGAAGFEVAVVGRQDYQINVGPLGLADHGERTKDVDALLALALDHPPPVGTEHQAAFGVALVAVLQRPVRDRDSLVTFPVRFLGLVPRVGPGVVLSRRLSSVDQHV